VNLADVDQTEVHDRFRLGVVIYYLLFSGPPFRGLWQGAGDSLEQSELIRRGLWPFSGDKLVVPSNTTIPLNILHRDLHALFLRCFNEGHKFPQKRPTAEEWRGTLEAALNEVIRCGKIDSHYYSKSYGKCYWCERASDLNFDIFPGKSIATVTPTPLPKVAPTPLTNFTENLPKGITLEMVGLPAGQFLMGSSERDNEKPPHQVQVNSFAIGKYPITQAQYQAVMGNNPSHFKNNPQNPVEKVSWDDAQAFCQKLSQITGKTYRLPTEAEWEYACRAGTTTRYYFGDDDNQLGDYAWGSENSNDTTHPVGQKKPNGWGLYDMIGNVWEWCEDNWHGNYIGAPDDGSAWLDNDNDYPIVRGGSWYLSPALCRSACRSSSDRRVSHYISGFRVVCVSTVTSTQLRIATVTPTPLPKVSPPPPSSPSPPPAKLTLFTENLPKGVTLEMVGLPAGKFLMGSSESDDEKPPHQVKVNSFAIGKYPITQAQYQAVMGNNPSYFKNNPQNPVECVSWNYAKAFCQKLSRITGKTYRLPTEAEWEYACRAGTTTRYYFGDDANQLGDYAWYYGNSGGKTHPVGQKKPNGWGLYDMSGNVWEWCEDNWHGNYIGAPDDGSAWLDNDNDYPIVRGGSWYGDPNLCRSAYRGDNDRLFLYVNGFRVVCGARRTL
jgi:formylglycine-generating enzyme required for sulfatase activity